MPTAAEVVSRSLSHAFRHIVPHPLPIAVECINSNCNRYFQARAKWEKWDITMGIVHACLESGRFLEHNRKESCWTVVPVQQARQKVAHALQYQQRQHGLMPPLGSSDDTSSQSSSRQSQRASPIEEDDMSFRSHVRGALASQIGNHSFWPPQLASPSAGGCYLTEHHHYHHHNGIDQDSAAATFRTLDPPHGTKRCSAELSAPSEEQLDPLEIFGQHFSLADPRSLQSQEILFTIPPTTAPSPTSYREIACQIGNQKNASCCGRYCCLQPQVISGDDSSRQRNSSSRLFLHPHHHIPMEHHLSPWDAAVAHIFPLPAAAAQQDIYAPTMARPLGTNNTNNNHPSCFSPLQYEDAVVRQVAINMTLYSPWEENHHDHHHGSGTSRSIDRVHTTADGEAFHHRPRHHNNPLPNCSKKRHVSPHLLTRSLSYSTSILSIPSWAWCQSLLASKCRKGLVRQKALSLTTLSWSLNSHCRRTTATTAR